ncbi:MAG: hypothetical protein PHS32_03735 [Rhodoferax sp.]|uniref:hypothetical protein n=1 Tax=Rhodoferax sp. TaxID=50421 RepID=UPI00260C7BBF|nr:hypothetical protein [Rhodoferax sp.]MDD5332835.1 hypothetical protein [Rhodoferax sp.]
MKEKTAVERVDADGAGLCICQNGAMRLTPNEQQVIREASLRYFGVRPRLFGSRVDDSKLGGDIDLYIEAPMSAERGFDAKIRMVADIWLKIGERKIDVVVNSGDQNMPIYEVAKRDGVWL